MASDVDRMILQAKFIFDNFVILYIFHLKYELLYHAFGRHQYRQVTSNLDIFIHRFNLIQFWPATEICLTRSLNKRVQVLRKFIKIAAQ